MFLPRDKQLRKLNLLLFSVCALLYMLGFCFSRQSKAAETFNDRTDKLCLNEVCSRNFSVLQSEDGDYYDYIELYNPTEKELSLEGYSLFRSSDDKKKFVFGRRTIAAKGYVLVYASGADETDGSEYAGFKISNSGECLFLADADGTLIDSVEIPSGMKYDTSYARSEDGVGEWENREATPGYTNTGARTVVPESLAAPSFSVESGFYEDAFTLVLEASESDQIFYTLDGSEPTMHSIPYTNPIMIDDASDQENVYSARTDLSAAFFAEEDRFAVPEEKVDKAVIIRAAAFAPDGSAKSKTETRTYFVGYDEKDYEPFAFISLVTDPDNLFGYERGIYVSGKRFDDFVKSGEINELPDPENWRRWLANYSNRGREWERPVHIDFFDASRKPVLGQEVGIRIKGGTSRSFTQKSLSLYARDIYSGNDEFYTPFFGEKGRRRAVLFSGAQDYRTKMQDVLMNHLCRDRNFSTMASYPCYVFINGEYWGAYHLMEVYGDDYLQENYGVPKGEAVIIRNGALDTDVPGGGDYAAELYALMESDKLIDAEEYENICELIDIQSYIDYYATQIYVNRGEEDWPKFNEGYWRTMDDLGGEYTDGKWRWMLFDTNWALLNDSDENSIAYTKEKSNFFRRLCQNETFRERFVQTMCDLSNATFCLENVVPEFSGLTEQMRGPAVKDLKKYYGNNRTAEDFEEEVQSMALFFQERPAYMMQLLQEEFDLKGTLENVTVSCTEGGMVTLNTVQISDGMEWTGQYFTDYPVALTAIPEKGYRFAGWRGDAVSEDASVKIRLQTGGIALQAVFEKE